MKYSTTPGIAREAWPFALPLIGLALCLYIITGSWILLAVFAVIVVAILAFFRNPRRVTPDDPNIIIAPADGVVTAAGIIPDASFPEGKALRVAVFMSLLNAHINWSPCAGTVEETTYVPGKFLNAMHDKAAEENEHKVIVLRRTDGKRVVFTPVAGLVARRIVNPIEPGDVLAAGERVGLIRFGSKVETRLPADSELAVSVGQKVRGGLTPIARINITTTENTDHA